MLGQDNHNRSRRLLAPALRLHPIHALPPAMDGPDLACCEIVTISTRGPPHVVQISARWAGRDDTRRVHDQVASAVNATNRTQVQRAQGTASNDAVALAIFGCGHCESYNLETWNLTKSQVATFPPHDGGLSDGCGAPRG